MTGRAKKQLSAAILVVIVALAVRLPGIGETMTVDEFNWMERSQVFWHKLFRNGDVSGTFLSSHPGATVMWLAGAGLTWQEAQLSFDMEQNNVRHFRKYVTAPMAIASAILIGGITALSIPLLGVAGGTLAGLFLALDPYIVGMNRVVHPDAILGLFMLAAILSALNYRMSSQHWYTLIAGVATGLALVTKLLPALWLGPILLLIYLVPKQLSWRKIPWRAGLTRLAVLIGLAAVTFLIVWPAPLTKSDFLIGYIVRDASKVAQVEHVALEATDSDEHAINPLSFYVRTVAARVPLHMQLLALVGLIAAVVRGRKNAESGQRSTILWLLLYAIGFFVLVTFVAKKGDRYAMPLLVTFPVIASWGLVVFWHMFGRLRQPRYWKAALVLLTGLAVLASLWQAVPFAIAYNNPLFPDVRPHSQQGWGEGLEAAAAWVNQHPLAESLYIASWYPSVTRTYFNGSTLSLSSREDHRVSYVITYRNMHGRAQDSQASNVLDEFKEKEPVHVVEIGGVPYAWIYETENVGPFARHVGEVTAGVEVGQTVLIEEDTWSEIDIAFATFSSRDNRQDVVLSVYEDIDALNPVRTATVSARDIIDNEWQRFEFTPLANSAGEEYYVSVTSPTSRPGDAVTVRYADADVKPGEMVLIRRPRLVGEARSEFIKSGDIAYRLP